VVGYDTNSDDTKENKTKGNTDRDNNSNKDEQNDEKYSTSFATIIVTAAAVAITIATVAIAITTIAVAITAVAADAVDTPTVATSMVRIMMAAIAITAAAAAWIRSTRWRQKDVPPPPRRNSAMIGISAVGVLITTFIATSATIAAVVTAKALCDTVTNTNKTDNKGIYGCAVHKDIKGGVS